MFQGMMPEDLNIYVTTASNAVESSWGTYCPGMQPPPPPEFLTCLGDLYSIAWMEDRFPLFCFLLDISPFLLGVVMIASEFAAYFVSFLYVRSCSVVTFN